MPIYSRTRRLLPSRHRQAIAWAQELADLTTRLTGIDVALYRAMVGSAPGTLVWSTEIDSLAHLDEVTTELARHDDVLDLLEHGADLWMNPFEDALFDVVIASESIPPMPYRCLFEATIASGRSTDAIAWGAELCEYVDKMSGVPLTFTRSSWGAPGRVAWIAESSSAAGIDQLLKIAKMDLGYLQRIDRANGLFQHGESHSTMLRRVA